LKRGLDIVVAGSGLVVTSPLMAAIWWRIRKEGGGPVLYRGVRAGRHGRPFQMYKFRTMVPNADLVGGPSTPDDDARITVAGKFLRRHKLDELPQLFNVLKGDMSLVGPRPQVLDEVAGYTPEERELLEVRPGITDWASIRFRDEGRLLSGHEDPDLAYAELIRPEKTRLGLEYVRHATLLDDLRILWATATLPWHRPAGDFLTVTETWGSPASPEQVEMAYFRYRLVGDLAAGGRVLEVGCGAGMGLDYLSKRAAEAVGCDVSASLVSQAQEHLPGVTVVEAGVPGLPFDDASFDVVAMLEMLYYVDAQAEAIAEAVRLLRPGGSLVVAAPNPDRPTFNPSPFSTRYLRVPELALMLETAGLRVTVYGAFPVTASTRRDRWLERLRGPAVKLRLVPPSMRAKALVKRALYGRLPRLEAVRDGMADLAEAHPLDPSRPSREYRNLYAVGVKA
jgi:lipopolysaccharide/colanic/teichoic acid biosynthesis glycosyltransferase/SAM-dependent methyltransferase